MKKNKSIAVILLFFKRGKNPPNHQHYMVRMVLIEEVIHGKKKPRQNPYLQLNAPLASLFNIHCFSLKLAIWLLLFVL